MAFGQSFIIGSIAGKVAGALTRILDGSEEDAKAIEKQTRMRVGLMVAAGTMDPAGAAATVAADVASNSS